MLCLRDTGPPGFAEGTGSATFSTPMASVPEQLTATPATGYRVLPAAALAALVVLVKLATLDTPAYWDEMEWVRQAQDLSTGSLLRALPGFRPASLFWGHPPGLHFILALLWKVSPPSMASAHLLIAGFAALGVAATFLLARHLYDQRTAWLAALLLLLAPVYFTQAGMFLADVPVAALGVLSIYLALTGRFRGYLIAATVMLFIKETGMAVVAALVVYRLLSGRSLRRAAIIDALRHSLPLGFIVVFFILQKVTTGHFLFIYDFSIQLFEPSLAAVVRQALLITRWIFVDQHRVVLTLVIGLGLLLRPRLRRPELLLFLLILVMSGYSFSVMYYLPRYLMPVLPLFYLLAAASLLELIRAPRWQAVGALATIGFMIWSLQAQPLRGNAEYNLRYRDIVALSQTMALQLAAEAPDTPIVTHWPHSEELYFPLLGYTPRALPVKRLVSGMPLPDSAIVLLGTTTGGRMMRELREQALREGWAVQRRLTGRGVELQLLARGAAR